MALTQLQRFLTGCKTVFQSNSPGSATAIPSGVSAVGPEFICCGLEATPENIEAGIIVATDPPIQAVAVGIPPDCWDFTTTGRF